jgi:glycosyltransferase involved in cell wall biosynthesis
VSAAAIVLGSMSALWLVVAAFGIAHLRQLRTLSQLDPPEPRRWPRVSVVIAARDEAAGLEAALRSRLDDDYPDLEIVLVDDRSTDGTGDIARALAAQDARLSVVRVHELPDGWLGKVHALERGVRRITGDWLLFSDADVHVVPGALRRAVAYALDKELDMVALVPEYTSRDPLVSVLWTVFLAVMMLVLAPNAVRNPRSKLALGSGAFNLVRCGAYDRTPGFAYLRLETGDDVTLAGMVKAHGGAIEVLDGRGSATVEIYRDVAGFIRGVEKNGGTTAAHPWRFTLGMTVFLAVAYAPIAALFTGVLWLQALGVAGVISATALMVIALRTNTGRWAPALLWPLGVLLFAYGSLRATWLVRERGGVLWRDTFYPLDQIEAQRRFEF